MNRLINDLLKIFHRACDCGDHEVARLIIGVLESQEWGHEDRGNRRIGEAIAGACARLWDVRHPGVVA